VRRRTPPSASLAFAQILSKAATALTPLPSIELIVIRAGGNTFEPTFLTMCSGVR
jgi:hypothetical protein